MLDIPFLGCLPLDRLVLLPVAVKTFCNKSLFKTLFVKVKQNFIHICFCMKANPRCPLYYIRLTAIIILLSSLVETSFAQVRNRNKAALRYEDVSGFCNILEVGGGKGIGHISQDFTAHFIGISNVFGYVIDHHFIIGLGIGANAYNGGMRLPAYIDIRYRFRPGKVTPFLYTDAGGILNVKEIMNYGLMVNPGIGIISKIDQNLAFIFSIGLFSQSYPDNASFINFKLGVLFLSNGGNSCLRR
jgi:hypothetical protein